VVDSEGHPRVWIIRHGETEWSRSGQHTSRTDLPLTGRGEEQARELGRLVRSLTGGHRFDLVLCSPMLRARRTAELAGLSGDVDGSGGGGGGSFEVDGDLCEWDYGELEGRVTPEIRGQYPGWSIWDGPWPGGETAAAVAARADRVVDRVVGAGVRRVALIGHGHFSRALSARWVGAEIGVGRWLDLDTASVSELGWSRGDRVLRLWNLVAGAA
jgi:broad specificity phosphatase PhoE